MDDETLFPDKITLIERGLFITNVSEVFQGLMKVRFGPPLHQNPFKNQSFNKSA